MNLMPNANRVDVVASMPPQQLIRAANVPARDIGPGVECLICNGSLEGQRTDERCRQCGAAIGRSLQGNFLKFAQPTYVRRLVKGLTLILWGSAALVVLAAMSQVMQLGSETQVPFLLAGFAAGLATLIGMWLVTDPAPNPLDAVWELNARKRIRITLVAAVAAMPVALIAELFNVVGAARSVFEVVLLILGAAGIVGIRDSLLHLRKLALRIPNLGLARYSLYAAWGLPISLGLMIVLGFVIRLAQSPGEPADRLAGGATCAGWLAVVGFGVMTVILLMQYRSLATDQATFAEHTWAHPGKAAVSPSLRGR